MGKRVKNQSRGEDQGGRRPLTLTRFCTGSHQEQRGEEIRSMEWGKGGEFSELRGENDSSREGLSEDSVRMKEGERGGALESKPTCTKGMVSRFLGWKTGRRYI